MMEYKKDDIITKYAAHVSPGKVDTYTKYDMLFVPDARKGCYIHDMEGKRFLNCHCNGGVFNRIVLQGWHRLRLRHHRNGCRRRRALHRHSWNAGIDCPCTGGRHSPRGRDCDVHRFRIRRRRKLRRVHRRLLD